MTKQMNKPIEIQLGSGFIPLRIGGIDFKFSTSDAQQTKYYEKYSELMDKQKELEKFQKDSKKLQDKIDANKDTDYSKEQDKFIDSLSKTVNEVSDLVTETVDCALGDGAFEKLHEKAGGDSDAVLEAFLVAMEAIKNYKQKTKLNKYIADKKK